MSRSRSAASSSRLPTKPEQPATRSRQQAPQELRHLIIKVTPVGLVPVPLDPARAVNWPLRPTAAVPRPPAAEPEELARLLVERINAGNLEGIVVLYEPEAFLLSRTAGGRWA